MKYSIVYLTNRIEPLLHWTLDSLANEIPAEERGDVQFILVDKFAEDQGRRDWVKIQLEKILNGFNYVHTTVKPNVWCGSHRLTSQVAGSENAGLLLRCTW